jgi:hypothetical protein
MHLKQYPKAIALQQTQLAELRQTIRQVKETLAAQELEIDKAVVFDDTLKNDLVQNDSELLALLGQLTELEDYREAGEIELNRLLNQWTIAKLEKRQTIAQMEIEARLAS